MIICKKCHAQQLDGTLFCAECGENLIEKKSSTVSLGWRDEGVASVPSDSPESSQSNNRSLALFVFKTRRRMKLDVSKDLVVGRRDIKTGAAPDIDLEDDGGYDAGVSRKHAMITFQDGVYYMTDLNSSNGTFRNGYRLPPNKPVPIHQGDELKLGTLLVRVQSL